MKPIVSLIVAFLLTACVDQPVRVASKDFAENQILAEMLALLIEDAGVPVDRQIPYGETEAVFQGLRTGEIDIYPEYTGTGLELLGLPPAVDTTVARETITREIGQLGISSLDPLGFETTYAVVVEASLAQERGLEAVDDLQSVAPELRLVVAEAFARRPEVGLQAFLDRYGLEFAETEIINEDERQSIYDLMLDGRFDVAVGFGTDPEIETYGLVILQPTGDFFPSYAAIPIVSTSTIVQSPEVAVAVSRLAGKLDLETMRSLNNEVVINSRPPREVAREALADLDLIEDSSSLRTTSFLVAVDPADVGDPMTNNMLRAARRAIKGHDLRLLETQNPIGTIFGRTARIALVPSIAQFRFSGNDASHIEKLETIAAVGSYYIHTLAMPNGPEALGDAKRIATGPIGSSSHKLASAVSGITGAELVPLDATSAEAAIEALKDGLADSAIVLTPLGNSKLSAALADQDKIELISAADWWRGAARLSLPFLRIATIPENTYGPNIQEAITTLAMQATVVGPAPSASALGDQGPSTYSYELKPITDQAVLAFNENLGSHPDVGRYLRPATVLTPQFQRIERALNRTPGFTVLSLGIFAFLCWAIWLLVRKEPLPK
jgi:osmoprotectant transport system permease protein